MSVENLTRASDTVVIGTIETVGPGRELPQGSAFTVVTDVTINVSQYVKGPLPDNSLVFSNPGGTVGCYSVIVSGTSNFVSGEKVLLFLGKDEQVGYLVAGGPRGKYVITDGTAYWGDPSNSVALSDLIAEIQGYS